MFDALQHITISSKSMRYTSRGFLVICATLANKSCVNKDTLSNGIVAYSDSDEECMELPDKEYRLYHRQTVTNISKNIKSSNIMI